ncbi:acetyltransferase [Candidatus Caldatribacterium sp.]|uniref:acetyltransferase n=1 Tax=Candidatus Caldatribacterium sp. TaxID=2282143 RepID=UPI002999CFDD|nr:acetyltransferase [Candidatus Caldatribacterium sp.]MDW8082133.1 acetyltransferase [Candidatus Calescibacterium sp.]
MGVYVIGAGGHAKVVVSTLLEAGVSVDGLFDDDVGKVGSAVMGVRVLGTLADARAISPQAGIIGIGDNRTRRRIAEELVGWEWISVIHPRAYVHPSVCVGPGVVVFAGSVIQPGVHLGAHVIVNTGVTVDHDCVVHDFAHLAPGVHLAGAVEVGEGVLLGVGSVVIPGVRIGEWAVVGAGSVVVRDIPSCVTVVGVPAKPISPRTEGC